MPSNRRVDVHHHFYPPQYLEAMRKTAGHDRGGVNFPGVATWTPAKTLEEMDKHGVQTAILSLSPPGARMLDKEGNRNLARTCNEFAIQVGRDHPGRFGLFAPVPMPDVEGTLKEIEYALDTLKADGIQLMTSYGNKWIGDPEYNEVFDELNRRKALVYVHPLASPCSTDLMEWVPDALIEYPHDTSRAVLSMLFSGTLARCPDIRFIFSHSGGTIPFLSGRILHSGSNRLLLDRVPKGRRSRAAQAALRRRARLLQAGAGGALRLYPGIAGAARQRLSVLLGRALDQRARGARPVERDARCALQRQYRAADPAAERLITSAAKRPRAHSRDRRSSRRRSPILRKPSCLSRSTLFCSAITSGTPFGSR